MRCDTNFDGLAAAFMCSDLQEMLFRSSVRRPRSLVSPLLAAEVARATWHHETEVNFETLLALVVRCVHVVHVTPPS